MTPDESRAPQGVGPIAVFGAGRVGRAFARALAERGEPAHVIWNRSPSPLATHVGELPLAELAQTRLLLLCVSDDAIADVAALVRPHLAESCIIAHCSGALPASVLGLGLVASLHPLQTFVPGATVDWARIHFVIEGSKAALGQLEAFARQFSPHVHRLRAGTKALYHAAAVMASNHVVLLLEASRQLLALAGIDEIDLLEPLVGQTFHNVRERGGVEALTGPLVRGDVATIAAHLEALDARAPQLAGLYRALAREALALLVRDLPAERRAALESLL